MRGVNHQIPALSPTPVGGRLLGCRVTTNRCEVTATELDEAGCGVGASDGKTVHVADLLPGERAEVAIDHTSPHRPEAWARIVRRLGAPSTERVAPACPGFGRCGGCVWQHLAYPAQLAKKRERVVQALADLPAVRTGDVTVAEVRPSPQLFGYRNKGKYVAGIVARQLVLGAYAPRSHTVIDTLGCKVVAPIIDEVASWVRGAAETAQLGVYNEATRRGELRYVVVREANGDVMVALVIAPGTPADKLERVASAMSHHPAVRGLVAIENDRKDGSIIPSGATQKVLFGHGHLVEDLGGVSIVVGAAEFLQVNRAQAAAMYARIAELALDGRTQGRAVDLFAGLGGIGLHLARAGLDVVTVEIDRDAVAQLTQAAERAGLRLHALAGDAGDLSHDVREQIGTVDIAVVNPPRKGLTEGARDLLVELRAPTIVYVSCGPESLGRDLAALAAHGYIADTIEPFDLMPGTAQVETIVRLRRAA
ncbi:MAG: (Uracil-5)-methyltransferase [Myxococcales bacterium]|nr:(Uracil-5)-methyltransferase [Myxococcales bacterium]